MIDLDIINLSDGVGLALCNPYDFRVYGHNRLTDKSTMASCDCCAFQACVEYVIRSLA